MNKIAQTAKEFEEGKNISLNDIMTDDFVNEHTDYNTFEDFLIASELISEGEEITEEILNSNDFDEHVKKNTSFGSWQDMLQTASVEYMKRQLGF